MYFTLLDLLRFGSSLSVLFHHTFTFVYGRLGIYLFFIISGFVIYFSLGRGIKEYIVGRFLRLYPLFWVCCTITFLVTVFFNEAVPFKKYLLDMLMFNDGKIATMVDGSYWTLTFELLFYFYIGVFVTIFSTKHLEWFYVAWLFIAFFGFFFYVDQHIVMKLLSIRFAPYFVFGGMLALCVDRWKTSTSELKFMYSSVLLFAAVMPLYVSSSLLAQQGTITNFTGSFDSGEMRIVESFFIIVPLFVFGSYFFQSKRFKDICFLLGGITYPLYLLHWKIGKTILSPYTDYGKVTTLSILFAIVLIAFSYWLSVVDLRVRKVLKAKILGHGDK
jgi:peptidoglycan/LPS O-acetylase OafA/YrhL